MDWSTADRSDEHLDLGEHARRTPADRAPGRDRDLLERTARCQGARVPSSPGSHACRTTRARRRLPLRRDVAPQARLRRRRPLETLASWTCFTWNTPERASRRRRSPIPRALTLGPRSAGEWRPTALRTSTGARPMPRRGRSSRQGRTSVPVDTGCWKVRHAPPARRDGNANGGFNWRCCRIASLAGTAHHQRRCPSLMVMRTSVRSQKRVRPRTSRHTALDRSLPVRASADQRSRDLSMRAVRRAPDGPGGLHLPLPATHRSGAGPEGVRPLLEIFSTARRVASCEFGEAAA